MGQGRRHRDDRARRRPPGCSDCPAWSRHVDYRRAWLARDLLAGLALTGILVPAGMAYAEASGLPAITGLYATIVPLLAYAVLGPSRLLILGPDSSLVPLILAALAPFAMLGSAARIEHAALLAIMVGILSRPWACCASASSPTSSRCRSGKATWSASPSSSSRPNCPLLFGFEVEGDGVVDRFVELGRSVLEGQTNAVALALGLVCLAIILGARRIDRAHPGRTHRGGGGHCRVLGPGPRRPSRDRRGGPAASGPAIAQPALAGLRGSSPRCFQPRSASCS